MPTGAGDTTGLGAGSSTGDPWPADTGVGTGPIDGSTTDPTTTSGPAGTSSDGGSTGTSGDPDLLLWLDFDDPDAPFADASGHAADAVCDVDQCPATVESGTARFDGIDDHLTVADAPAFVLPDGFTIAVRMSVDAIATGAYQDVFTRAYGTSSYDTWAFGFPPELAGLRFVVFDGTSQVVGGEIPWPDDGGWHHVAATWDGARTRLYFEGALVVETEVAAIAFDSHPILVGGDVDQQVITNYFAGAVDDARLYGRALSDDEIAALAAG